MGDISGNSSRFSNFYPNFIDTENETTEKFIGKPT